MNNKFEIYHSDWIDYIQLFPKENLLCRLNDKKDVGKYILNDLFLIIDWEKWNKEYFYKKNNIYYLIDNQNTFNLNIGFVYLFRENRNDLFLIDNDSRKIYFEKKLELYGEIFLDNNKMDAFGIGSYIQKDP